MKHDNYVDQRLHFELFIALRDWHNCSTQVHLNKILSALCRICECGTSYCLTVVCKCHGNGMGYVWNHSWKWCVEFIFGAIGIKRHVQRNGWRITSVVPSILKFDCILTASIHMGYHWDTVITHNTAICNFFPLNMKNYLGSKTVL